MGCVVSVLLTEFPVRSSMGQSVRCLRDKNQFLVESRYGNRPNSTQPLTRTPTRTPTRTRTRNGPKTGEKRDYAAFAFLFFRIPNLLTTIFPSLYY